MTAAESRARVEVISWDVGRMEPTRREKSWIQVALSGEAEGSCAKELEA